MCCVWEREKVRKGWKLMKLKKNLLNMISSNAVSGIIGCHHGLHLHQVLLHYIYISIFLCYFCYYYCLTPLSLSISITFSLYIWCVCMYVYMCVFLSHSRMDGWRERKEHCKVQRGEMNRAPQETLFFFSFSFCVLLWLKSVCLTRLNELLLKPQDHRDIKGW